MNNDRCFVGKNTYYSKHAEESSWYIHLSRGGGSWLPCQATLHCHRER